MAEKDPLAQRLDSLELQKRAERQNSEKSAEARAKNLQWLVDRTPAAYDELAKAIKDRINKIAAEISDSPRRFSWQEDSSRDFIVTLGQDSMMDVNYAYGNPLVVPPQIQTTLRPTSFKNRSGIRTTYDPVYDAGTVAWRSHGRAYTKSALVDKLLLSLLEYDDNQRDGA